MQLKFHTVTIEDLMPQDHFLRRLEAALDLSFVRVETAHLYSRRYGRPPIDGGAGEIPPGGLSVRHPLGASDRAADPDGS